VEQVNAQQTPALEAGDQLPFAGPHAELGGDRLEALAGLRL
jgi:hypothetical protein